MADNEDANVARLPNNGRHDNENDVKVVIEIQDSSGSSSEDDDHSDTTMAASSVEEIMVVHNKQQSLSNNSRNNEDRHDRGSCEAARIRRRRHRNVHAASSQETFLSCNNPARMTTTTRMMEDDYAIAKALSEQEPRCSQYTPKRRRGHFFKCNICLEDNLESFKGYTLSSCHHRFCIMCLQSLIKTSSSSSSSAMMTTTSSTNAAETGTRGGGPNNCLSSGIMCPQEKCSNVLALVDIQYIFRDDKKAWDDYTQKANMRLLEHQVSLSVTAEDGGGGGVTGAASAGITSTSTSIMSDLRRCPAGHCNYIFIYDPTRDGNSSQGSSNRHYDCPLCNSSFCLQCDANEGKVGPAHVGLSCMERQQELAQQAKERQKFEQWKIDNTQADIRFQQLMQTEQGQGITRPCPKCKRMVTKNGGCDHMICICGHTYNWSQS